MIHWVTILMFPRNHLCEFCVLFTAKVKKLRKWGFYFLRRLWCKFWRILSWAWWLCVWAIICHYWWERWRFSWLPCVRQHIYYSGMQNLRIGYKRTFYILLVWVRICVLYVTSFETTQSGYSWEIEWTIVTYTD